MKRHIGDLIAGMLGAAVLLVVGVHAIVVFVGWL